MNTNTFAYDDHVLEVITEEGEVGTTLEPDPYWTLTDGSGHLHTTACTGHVVEYPTLELVSGEASWCRSCTVSHPNAWWECRECREEIVPGLRESLPRRVPGLTTYVLDGEPITPLEARQLLTLWQRSVDAVGEVRAR